MELRERFEEILPSIMDKLPYIVITAPIMGEGWMSKFQKVRLLYRIAKELNHWQPKCRKCRVKRHDQPYLASRMDYAVSLDDLTLGDEIDG